MVEFRKFVPKGPIDNEPALAQVRRAITWTSDDPVHRRRYEALGVNELRILLCMQQ